MKFFNKLDKNVTEAELKIMNFIENNTKVFLNNNLIFLANKTFVSPPMITKFSKKYGFKGFRDMQQKILISFHKYDFPNIPKETKNILSISKKIALLINYGIEGTLKKIDTKSIFAISSLIYNSNDIFIFGDGSSKFAADNLRNKLIIMGKKAYSVKTISDIKLWGDQNNPKTLLIIFSHSLSSKNVNDIIKFADRNNIFKIIITANKKILEKNDLMVFRINTIEDNERIAIKWFSPKISFIYISDVIAEVINTNFPVKNKIKFK